eukprot:COSAG02_NODE_39428_length_417_cov_0.955975_1_plen_40_part_01
MRTAQGVCALACLLGGGLAVAQGGRDVAPRQLHLAFADEH